MSDNSEQVEAASVVEVAPSSAPVISDVSWETAISSWIDSHVRNSPVAGATEAWNHLMGALPHLRAALETELGKKE